MIDLERLEQVYGKEKLKTKALEEKNADYREELLNIKNDKQELSKNYKVKNDKLAALQAETEALTKEKVRLEV